MVFTVNGVNHLPYLEDEGLTITRNDIDSSDSGRTQDGMMWRGKIASKWKIEAKYRKLKQDEAQAILLSLDHEYVTVIYTNPELGQVTMQMYNSEAPASVYSVDDDGNLVWGGISANLIQR